MKLLSSLPLVLACSLLSFAAAAKLPPPSDEAKAKAAETAAKTAHNAKMDAYLLCKSQDKVAAKVNKSKAKSDLPACADPGKFVYPPPAAAAAATPAGAAPVAAPKAAPAAATAKK